jgi:hypothetical protein
LFLIESRDSWLPLSTPLKREPKVMSLLDYIFVKGISFGGGETFITDLARRFEGLRPWIILPLESLKNSDYFLKESALEGIFKNFGPEFRSSYAIRS